jgi:hypothetical protein
MRSPRRRAVCGGKRIRSGRVADQRIEKWRQWIEVPITNDVLAMHLRRFVWHRLGEIIDAHGSLPGSYFWQYLTESYSHTQAVAIRRQAVPDTDSRNLGQLIREVAGDPTLITREFWIGTQDTEDPFDLTLAEQNWQKRGGGGDYLDPAIPEADLDHLTAAAAEVKRYVDENVAHSDKRPAEVVITFDDMHEVIEAVSEPFRRYALLLTGKGWGNDLTPVIQDDWEAVFREPWIRPESGGA